MAISQVTTSDYSQTVGTSPAYLPPVHRERADRLRGAYALYKGRHREFFLGAANTQFDFREVRVNGRLLPVFVMFNLLGLISRKHADLLFGEKPSIRVSEPAIQKVIDDLLERSGISAALHSAAVEASWAGETCLEIVREGTETFIVHTPIEEIYPEGPLLASKQYASYVRYAHTQIMIGKIAKTLLLETRYTAGAITRQCFVIDNGSKTETASTELWPVKRPDGSPLPLVEPTGLPAVSIIWIPNELDGCNPVSDYDGAIHLQDELNAKQTQIARVLAKHADPKIFFASGSADSEGNIRTEHDAVFGNTKDDKPEYITWQAELANAMEDRKFTLNALLISTEMSAVLLGLKEGAAPDAAKKLRLEATNSLAKAQRKAAYWQPALQRAIKLAIKSEGVAAEIPVAVEMRDGLPVDPLDTANEIATLRGAGTLSKRRALEKQNLEPAAVETELAQLLDEASAGTPSILLGGEFNETQDAPVETVA